MKSYDLQNLKAFKHCKTLKQFPVSDVAEQLTDQPECLWLKPVGRDLHSLHARTRLLPPWATEEHLWVLQIALTNELQKRWAASTILSGFWPVKQDFEGKLFHCLVITNRIYLHWHCEWFLDKIECSHWHLHESGTRSWLCPGMRQKPFRWLWEYPRIQRAKE